MKYRRSNLALESKRFKKLWPKQIEENISGWWSKGFWQTLMWMCDVLQYFVQDTA